MSGRQILHPKASNVRWMHTCGHAVCPHVRFLSTASSLLLAGSPKQPTVSDMYTIAVSVLGTNAETSLREDVESTIEAVRRGLITWFVPGRTVRWQVRCPSGRIAVGDITVNAIGERDTAIEQYVETIREILTEEATR